MEVLNITHHRKPYPAIDPLLPNSSQAGRTVVVCGGTRGIGHAIARNFCVAGAAAVIILARRPDVLQEAVKALADAYPKTAVSGKACDVFKKEEIERVWSEFEKEGTLIDVLVFSAVGMPALQPILEQGADRLWEDFENNVRTPVYWVEKLYKQPGHNSQKTYLYVSSRDAHIWDSAPQMPGYQLTKNSCTCVLQQIARDTPVDQLQILSFHPSTVFTEAAKSSGYTETTLPWTDENLPGQFAVWAASPAAKFLHGRFVWCEWDVDELARGEIRKKIDEDPWYLKVGVKGL